MPVDAWEDELVLKTYLLGPEDPLPHWERTGMSRIYPYAMQDDLSDEVRNVPYRALHVENEYLHMIVLPQLGGHMYSLYDKIAKREVFYRNNVVKYGLVARRGAWISGGIEFNFPQGHTCVTVSPVASTITQDPETGAASVHVGTTDLVSRMRWSVRLSLAPGEARMRQDVMLHNPTPIRQRHYFWANSAVPARDDLHLVYPATKCRTLGGEHPYPIQNGRDMSWYRNHERPNDIFALDVTEDFFGCYYEDLDVGLVHWSDHRQDFGKKFFTWGTADEGMIWVDLLTDDDGQYVELQSGRFVDQSTFEFLAPFQCVKWTEYWYPLHGMGGFTGASAEAAFDLRVGEGGVHVAALPNCASGPGELLLRQVGTGPCDTGEDLCRQPVEIVAGQPLRVDVSFPSEAPPARSYGAFLYAGDRCVGVCWQPALHLSRPRLELPTRPLPPPDSPAVTATNLWRHGTRAEKVADYERAAQLYGQAVAKDPGFTPAHVGLGVAALLAGRNQDAYAHLREALAADPDSDEARYYLGLASTDAPDTDAVEETLLPLLGRPTYRAEAAIAVSDSVAAGQWDSLLRDVPESPTARFLRSLARCEQGLPWGDLEAAWVADDPLDPGLVAECLRRAEAQGRTGQAAEALTRLVALLNDDPALWLELAHTYRLRGPWDATAHILRVGCANVAAVAADPLVRYTLAYLTFGESEQREHLQAAQESTAAHTFPSRPQELWMLHHGPGDGDWKARLYLGTLYASLGRREEALAAWHEAADIDDSDAILCRNLGLAYHLWKGDQATALGWYAKAVQRRPGEYRLYLEQDNLLRAAGEQAAGRLAALDAAPNEVRDRWEMAARRSDCLVNLSRWDEALELMRTHRFLPWEGARQMHALWTRALLGRAAEREAAENWAAALADYELALTYPRNLGVGRAAHPQEAKVRWLAAECAAGLGDEAKRAELLASAADEQHGRVCEADLYTLRARRALGQREAAEALAAALKTWADGRPADDELAKRIKEELA